MKSLKFYKVVGMMVLSTSALTACSSGVSTTPTNEVTEGFRIYDIKGASNLSSLSSNLKSALQYEKRTGRACKTGAVWDT